MTYMPVSVRCPWQYFSGRDYHPFTFVHIVILLLVSNDQAQIGLLNFPITLLYQTYIDPKRYQMSTIIHFLTWYMSWAWPRPVSSWSLVAYVLGSLRFKAEFRVHRPTICRLADDSPLTDDTSLKVYSCSGSDDRSSADHHPTDRWEFNLCELSPNGWTTIVRWSASGL